VPPDFLAEMIAAARARVVDARGRAPLAPPEEPRSAGRLRAALEAGAGGPADAGRRSHLALIAEVKRRSPSKGDIAPSLDAVAQGEAYETAGADAVSVLTEPTRFGGSLDDLRAVAAAVDLPVLRKDFIVDRYQLWEAAAAGAAAVLLIAAALPGAALRKLLDASHECGLDALVEVHDGADLDHARAAGATLIGINNRSLRTLDVDLAATTQLAPAIGPSAFIVSESGIATPEDARRVAAAGAQALLVGETLVRALPGALPKLIAALKHPERQR